MKTISKLFLAPAAAAMLLCGCVKETFPVGGSATASQVAASTAGLEAMVSSIASTLVDNYPVYGSSDGYAYDFSYPSILIQLTCMTGDLVVTGDSAYDWYSYWMEGSYMGTDWGLCDFLWIPYYSYIKLCNDVISSCTSVSEEELSAAAREALGKALTYRAQFYLDLVRLYEPKECTDPKIHNYTIPENIKGLSCVIITENTTEADTRSNPRATVEEVYELIFSDLERAEALLADSERSSITQPDLSCVYGVYARAWLERGTAGVDGAYQKAATYARKAIETGGYTPLNQEQWEDPTNGFNNADSNNAWMWAMRMSSTNIARYANFTVHMSNEESWSYYGWDVGRGINSLLYNEIADDDFRKHSWLDPKKFDYYEYKSCRSDYKTFFGSTLNAYASIKFRPGLGSYATYSVGAAVDIPLMRVEEMYLIEAEALGASSVSEGAAKLESFMQTYRQPSYTCSARSFTTLQEEVAKQVRIEFWGEGIPFWYKKRLALGIHLAGSNCKDDNYRLEIDGRAPWWNSVISLSEEQGNPAIVGYNNPEPSDTVDPVFE